jgi:hypothetical protein
MATVGGRASPPPIVHQGYSMSPVMTWERRIGNRKTPQLMFQSIKFADFTASTLSINGKAQHKNACVMV